jgi:hypothetical protein
MAFMMNGSSPLMGKLRKKFGDSDGKSTKSHRSQKPAFKGVGVADLGLFQGHFPPN